MLEHTAGKWIRLGAIAHDPTYTCSIAMVKSSPVAHQSLNHASAGLTTIVSSPILGMGRCPGFGWCAKDYLEFFQLLGGSR